MLGLWPVTVGSWCSWAYVLNASASWSRVALVPCSSHTLSLRSLRRLVKGRTEHLESSEPQGMSGLGWVQETSFSLSLLNKKLSYLGMTSLKWWDDLGSGLWSRSAKAAWLIHAALAAFVVSRCELNDLQWGLLFYCNSYAKAFNRKVPLSWIGCSTAVKSQLLRA